MNIVDYIPVGKENAITGERLRLLTGLTDRKIRNEIAIARRETCIINNQDGRGYYQPSNKDEVKRYIYQEEHRAKSILYSLNGAKKYYRELEGQTEIGGIYE